MRSAAAVLLVVGLVLGILTTPISTRAQTPTLLDLLPEASDVASGVMIADEGSQSLEEQAARFTDPAEAASLLADWGWQENAFRSFENRSRGGNGTPEVWIDVSVTRFQDAQGAAAALPYFLQDRAVALGQREMQPLRQIGDETRAIGGVIAGGYDVTVYVRSGPLLMRISTGANEGSPSASADLIAEGIIARVSGNARQTNPTRPISFYLPETLPPGLPPCLRAAGDGVLDFPALVERFPGIPDAAARLEDLEWEQGAYRQFSCDDPLPGTVGWIDMSVHRFHDAASAADAIAFFADARARATGLQPAPAVAIGNQTSALSGPAVNGVDYTLYLSTGPLLFRVSAGASAGDPRPSVEYVMSALFLIAVMSEGQDQAPGSSGPTATLPTAPSVTGDAAYDIVDLGTGAGNWSSAFDINARGQVLMTVGTADDPVAQIARDGRVLMWQDGITTDLTALGISDPIVINGAGTMLARSMGRNMLYESLSGSVMPLVGFEEDAYPADINNAGSVTGQVGSRAVIVTGDEVVTIPPPAGFGFVEPAAINKAGRVAGTARPSRTDESVQRAVLFADGVVTVLDPAPGASSSRATDLNDDGLVIGMPGIRGMHSIPEQGRAFLYDAATGTTTDIGTLPGYQNSMALAINNAGQVVGFSWMPANESDPIRRPYLYDHRTGVMTDLNTLIPLGSGWRLLDAFDINDAGQIVGRGLIGGEMHAFVLTPRR